MFVACNKHNKKYERFITYKNYLFNIKKRHIAGCLICHTTFDYIPSNMYG